MYKRQAVRLPYRRPVLPRVSSATSGFFFWGIREEPVVWASERVDVYKRQLVNDL